MSRRIVIHNHLPQRRTRDEKFTVVLSGAKAGGGANREEFTVEASGSVQAIYKAKQLWAEKHSNEPTVVGTRSAQDALSDFSADADKDYDGKWRALVKYKGQIAWSKRSFSSQAKALTYAQSAIPSVVKGSHPDMLKDGAITDTRDDDWSNDKIRRLYKSWVSGGQKPTEAIGELADNTGKSEQEIKRIVSSQDAYFNTASSDPYQYKEGAAAARAGKPSKPPYPDDSEANKMWVAGFKSVGKTGDESNADEMQRLRKALAA